MRALSDAARDTLAAHIKACEHVFLVCREVDPDWVIEDLQSLSPTHVFADGTPGTGTLTFAGGSFIFVRSDMADKAIANVKRISSNDLNIYVL